MKGARREKARANRRAKNAKRLEGGGKSKYAKKRARSAAGRYAPTSPFYIAPGTEAAEEARKGKDDGLDLLVAVGLCSKEVRAELRRPRRRVDEGYLTRKIKEAA